MDLLNELNECEKANKLALSGRVSEARELAKASKKRVADYVAESRKRIRLNRAAEKMEMRVGLAIGYKGSPLDLFIIVRRALEAGHTSLDAVTKFVVEDLELRPPNEDLKQR